MARPSPSLAAERAARASLTRVSNYLQFVAALTGSRSLVLRSAGDEGRSRRDAAAAGAHSARRPRRSFQSLSITMLSPRASARAHRWLCCPFVPAQTWWTGGRLADRTRRACPARPCPCQRTPIHCLLPSTAADILLLTHAGTRTRWARLRRSSRATPWPRRSRQTVRAFTSRVCVWVSGCLC